MSDIRENPPIYYSQVNKTAEKFMEACYSPSDMSNSEIGKYSAVVNGRRQDEPFGVIIDADGDEIEVLSSGRQLRTKIKGGKAALRIRGEGLALKAMNRTELLITGRLFSVELE